MRSRSSAVRRLLAGALAAGLVTTLAGACGGDDKGDSQTTIRFAWWGNEQRAKITQDAIALFMTKNPGIKVEGTTAVFDAFFQKLATETGGGNAPDVFQMSDRHVREYGDRNALLDLKPLVGSKIQTTELDKNVLTLGSIGDKMYGLPLGSTTTTLQWDPVVWKKAGAKEPAKGWTWDDLLEATTKISKAGGGKTFGISDFGREESWFKVWLSQQDKSLYTADGKLNYTEQDVTGWWELANMFRKAGAYNPAEPSGNPAGTPWPRKLTAAEFTPASAVSPGAYEVRGNEFKLAPWPSSTGKIGQYSEPPMLLSVSQRSKNQDAALKLADFLINDPEAGKILGLARGLPANLKIRESLVPELKPESKMVYEFEKSVAAEVKPGPIAPPKGASAITLAFAKIYEDVMYGKSSPADAAKKFMAEANQALAG